LETIFSDDLKAYEVALSHIGFPESSNETTIARNDTHNHAKLLIIEMIARAKESIKIKSTMFCNSFYSNEDLFEAIAETLEESSVNIEILIENVKDENSEILEKYSKRFANKISFKELLETDRGKINDFMLIDSHSFRWELSKTKTCSDESMKNVKAAGFFNTDKEEKYQRKVSLLNEYFMVLSNNARKIS